MSKTTCPTCGGSGVVVDYTAAGFTKEDFDDYDWKEFIGYAEFDEVDIMNTLAQAEGYNEGPEWLGIYLLKNGKYGFVSAGCDYTGWD
jgi:hypothetical protein